MVNRRIVAALVAMTAVAAVNLLGACTPSDDNDTFSTPTPTPVPTLPPGRNCQVVIASQSIVAPDLVDVFAIDGPADLWVNGAADNHDFIRYYEEGVSLAGTHVYVPDAPVANSTTGGSFTIILMGLNGTMEGAPVGVQDAVDRLEAVVDTNGTIAVVGSSLDLDFQGSWSSEDPGTPLDIDDFAIVDIKFGSDPAFTLGVDYGGFAVCYDVE